MKKVLSFAMMALMMGYVFVSCDEEKLTPEEEKPAVNNDSIPSDTVQAPADTIAYTLSMSLPKADSLYLATEGEMYGWGYMQENIEIGEFVLTHSHADWGFGDGNTFGEGFTFTSCADDSTLSYLNNAAITAQGVNTNAYFVANAGGGNYDGGLAAEISFKDSAAYFAKECYITNSTYAYLYIKNSPKYNRENWGAEDWFKLTITGYNKDTETGKVEVKLADGTNLINTWQQVDLTSLGMVTKIKFTVASTDNNQGGMVTPAYFCLDQLTVTDK